MNSSTKKLLKIIGIIAVSVAGLAVIGIVIFFLMFNSFLSKGDESRKQVQTSFDKIQLPVGMTYVTKEGTGDPLDSPDSFGWIYEYKYDTKRDKQAVADDLKAGLHAAGYTISSESINGKGSVEIGASNDRENVAINARVGTARATITATVIKYVEKP